MNARRKAAAPRGSKAPKTDAALIKAEKVSLAAWKRADENPEPNGDVNDKITALANKLDRFIGKTPCYTLAGAAVKLRRLLDPDVGMQAGDSGYDFGSLLQILGLIERLAEKGGAA